jgi:hypothetical protein
LLEDGAGRTILAVSARATSLALASRATART